MAGKSHTERRAGTVRESPTAAALKVKRAPGERVWVLEVPFELRRDAVAAGARWDSSLRHTIYVGRDLPQGLNQFAAADYSWERWVEDDLNGVQLAPAPPHDTFTPRPHQLQAVATIARAAQLGYVGFLEADDVGVGKTLTAVLGARAVARVRPVANVLVLAPLSVVPHWRRVIASAGDGGLRWCVINYDRARHLLTVPKSAADAKRLSTRNRRIAKDGDPKVQWDVIICDESHRLRNPTAQRTQTVVRLSKWHAATHERPFMLWMSATAGQDPTELSYLAPLLAQTTGTPTSALTNFGAWLQTQGFHVRQEGRSNRWMWTEDPFDRNIDIQRMRGLLFADPDPVAIRRLPTDIAGWPRIHRTLMPVDLTVSQHIAYTTAWTAFRQQMHLARRGHDPRSALAARQRFRQKASLIRVEGTVAHAKDALDNQRHVAISVEFLESADAIADALTAAGVSVARIDGTGRWNSEQQRLLFQHGRASVIVFTVTEGISLHANETLPGGLAGDDHPRVLLVHDVRYSGIATLQVEGRVHRDGQFAPAMYLFASGTIEEHITRRVVSRVESTQALVGDDVSFVKGLLDSLDAPHDHAVQRD